MQKRHTMALLPSCYCAESSNKLRQQHTMAATAAAIVCASYSGLVEGTGDTSRIFPTRSMVAVCHHWEKYLVLLPLSSQNQFMFC